MTIRERIAGFFGLQGGGGVFPTQSRGIVGDERFAPAVPSAGRESDAKEVSAPLVGKEAGAYVSKMDASSGTGLRLDVPVLRDKTLAIVDEMLCDDAVGTYLELKIIGALAPGFTVQPPIQEDPKQDEYVAFINDVFERMEGTLVEAMREMCSAIAYGFSCTNIVFAYLEDGEFAGKIGVRALKAKPQHNVRFNTDVFLNINEKDGIVFDSPDGSMEKYEKKYFLIFSYNKKWNNPYGWSDCIRAYVPWNSKRMVHRWNDIYLERHGTGTVIMRYDPLKVSNAEHIAMNEFGMNKQARGALKVSTAVEVQLHEPTSQGGDLWNGQIDQRNVRIARAIFLPDMVGFSQKPEGAYALGKKQFDFLVWILESLQQQIENAINEQLIRPLIDMNYGTQDAYPTIVFNPLTNEQKAWFVTNVLMAKDKGALDWDLDVANKVREAFDLSALTEEEFNKCQEEKKAMRPQPTDPNDPNAPPTPPGEKAPVEEPIEDEEEAPDDIDDEEDLSENLITARDMAGRLAKFSRVVYVGGPRTGKTSFALTDSILNNRPVRHADSLVGKMEWSESSDEVARWLAEPGPWVIEGVTTVRGIRKWLASLPEGERLDDFAAAYLRKPMQRRNKRQRGMGKGANRMWAEIVDDLLARGATVLERD